MKYILHIILHVIALTVLISIPAGFCQIQAPAEVHMNLGYVPFDRYTLTDLNSSQQAPAPFYEWVPRCKSQLGNSASVRACYQYAFANYYSQGVRGVRFQTGLRGAGESTALIRDSQGWHTDSAWSSKLGNFYTDLWNAGLRKVSPELQVLGQAGDVVVERSVFDDCSGTNKTAQFFQTAPFPYVPGYGQFGELSPGVPWGQGRNNGYYCAPTINDPDVYAGWPAIFNVVTTVVGRA